MLSKKLLVIALNAIFILPVTGQQTMFGVSEYGPVARMARLAQAQAPQPGQVAPGATQAPEQMAPAEPEQPPAPGPPLKITVVEGEDAQNDIGAGVGIAPKVMVTDETDNPVSGAQVVFALPMSGASGMFNGWVRTQTLRTDDSGLAAASGYAPNEIAGQFNIKVTATSGNSMGTAVIPQTNIEGQMRKRNKKWIILGAIGAAAAVIVVAATRDGDSGAPGEPVVITAGPISVGGAN